MKLCHNNVLQTTSKYTINNLICPPCYFSKHQQPYVTVWQKVPTFCQRSTLILSFSLSFRWFWKGFSHFLITSINNFLRLIAFVIQIYHLDDILSFKKKDMHNSLSSLIHLMHAIASAHVSTLSTSLIHVKNTTQHFCL